MFRRLKLKLKGSAKRSLESTDFAATNSTPNRELSQLIDRPGWSVPITIEPYCLLSFLSSIGGPDPETAGYIFDKASIKKLPKLHRAAWKGKWEKLDKQLMRGTSSCCKVDKHERLDFWTLLIRFTYFAMWLHDCIDCQCTEHCEFFDLSLKKKSPRVFVKFLVVKRGRKRASLDSWVFVWRRHHRLDGVASTSV